MRAQNRSRAKRRVIKSTLGGNQVCERIATPEYLDCTTVQKIRNSPCGTTRICVVDKCTKNERTPNQFDALLSGHLSVSVDLRTRATEPDIGPEPAAAHSDLPFNEAPIRLKRGPFEASQAHHHLAVLDHFRAVLCGKAGATKVFHILTDRSRSIFSRFLPRFRISVAIARCFSDEKCIEGRSLPTRVFGSYLPSNTPPVLCERRRV